MNSKEYWEQREAEALEHRITDEKEYQKRIRQIYDDMLDRVQNEINAFYGRYANKEHITIAEAKKRVKTADIKAYERKAKKYVKDKDFSDEANEEMRLYNLMMKVNRLEMLKANIGLELIAGHNELEKFMAEILQGRTMDELKRQAGILGKTIHNNAQLAHSIVNASFHNATFSDRIWQYQDLMKNQLASTLQTGFIQGKNPRAIAGELRRYWYGNDPKTGKGAVYCMERLMRTELARVQTEAQKQSFEKNGFEMYTFHTNTGCCPVCADLDGKHFKISEMMPGTNAAPMHPNCRCSCSAYEDSEEYERWLDFLANGGTTEEYNKLKARSKYRLKENEGIFSTLDNRKSTNKDVIKPRNVMKEMKKSQIGTELLNFLEENNIPVNIYYGVDVPKGRCGLFAEGEISIYADNTKTVEETALSTIHEATHAKINKPNSKNQELECYKNEYRHRGIELTKNVIDSIIEYVNSNYDYLDWE